MERNARILELSPEDLLTSILNAKSHYDVLGFLPQQPRTQRPGSASLSTAATIDPHNGCSGGRGRGKATAVMLTPNVTTHDLDKRYKQLALRIHPDKNPSPDAERAFQVATEAYAVLSDPNKKHQYDLTLVATNEHIFSAVLAASAKAGGGDSVSAKAAAGAAAYSSFSKWKEALSATQAMARELYGSNPLPSFQFKQMYDLPSGAGVPYGPGGASAKGSNKIRQQATSTTTTAKKKENEKEKCGATAVSTSNGVGGSIGNCSPRLKELTRAEALLAKFKTGARTREMDRLHALDKEKERQREREQWLEDKKRVTAAQWKLASDYVDRSMPKSKAFGTFSSSPSPRQADRTTEKEADKSLFSFSAASPVFPVPASTSATSSSSSLYSPPSFNPHSLGTEALEASAARLARNHLLWEERVQARSKRDGKDRRDGKETTEGGVEGESREAGVTVGSSMPMYYASMHPSPIMRGTDELAEPHILRPSSSSGRHHSKDLLAEAHEDTRTRTHAQEKALEEEEAKSKSLEEEAEEGDLVGDEDVDGLDLEAIGSEGVYVDNEANGLTGPELAEVTVWRTQAEKTLLMDMASDLEEIMHLHSVRTDQASASLSKMIRRQGSSRGSGGGVEGGHTDGKSKVENTAARIAGIGHNKQRMMSMMKRTAARLPSPPFSPSAALSVTGRGNKENERAKENEAAEGLGGLNPEHFCEGEGGEGEDDEEEEEEEDPDRFKLQFRINDDLSDDNEEAEEEREQDDAGVDGVREFQDGERWNQRSVSVSATFSSAVGQPHFHRNRGGRGAGESVSSSAASSFCLRVKEMSSLYGSPAGFVSNIGTGTGTGTGTGGAGRKAAGGGIGMPFQSGPAGRRRINAIISQQPATAKNIASIYGL